MLPGKPLVEPEGGGGATHDGGACDGVVERETFPHNMSRKEGEKPCRRGPAQSEAETSPSKAEHQARGVCG
jgi:hypothetical protein